MQHFAQFILVAGAIGAIGLVIALSALFGSSSLSNLKRAQEQSIAKAQPGVLVLLRGRVVPSEYGLIDTPVTFRPAVWWEQVLQTQLHKQLKTETVSRSAPFLIDDGSGQTALVVGDRAKAVMKPQVHESWGGLTMSGPAVERWIRAHGTTAGNQLRTGPSRHLMETSVLPGDTISVVGVAHRGPDGRLVIQNQLHPYGQVCFYDRTRRELLGSVRIRGVVGIAMTIVGALGAAGGYFVNESATVENIAKANAKDDDNIQKLDEVLDHWKDIKADAKKREPLGATDVSLRKNGNALLYYLDEEDDPVRKSFNRCVQISREHKARPGTGHQLEECTKADYVVVVHKRSRIDAKIDSVAKTYSPGVYQADGYVYDLGTGKYLGGIAIVARNAEKVSSGKGNAVSALWADLMARVEANVDEALKKAVSTAK